MDRAERNRKLAPEEQAFLRETRIGLSIIAVLSVIFLSASFARLSGWLDRGPIFPARQARLEYPAEVEASPFPNTIPTIESNSHLGQRESAPIVNELRDAQPSLPNLRTPNSTASNSTVPNSTAPSLTGPNSTEPISPRNQRKNVLVPAPTVSEVPPLIPSQANPLAKSSEPKPSEKDTPIDKNRFRPITSPQEVALPTMPNRSIPTESIPRNGNPETPFPHPANIVRDWNVEPVSGEQVEEMESPGNNTYDRKNGEQDNEKRFVETKANDSFWTLAQQHYGDGKFFRALYEWNKPSFESFDSEEIPVGVRIELPRKQELMERFPELCPQQRAVNPPNAEWQIEHQPEEYDSEFRTYEAKGTESIFEIARDELGQASRYLELIELNRDVLPEDCSHEQVLSKGFVLRLPKE